MVVFSREFGFFQRTQRNKQTTNLVPGKLRPPLGQPVRIPHSRVARHNALAVCWGGGGGREGEGRGGESYMTPDTSKEPAVYNCAELRRFIIASYSYR